MRRAGGSIIIPAHDEETLIRRTLAAFADTDPADLEVIVVANGCSDRTAALARTVPGIVVVEIDEASKTAALNIGDSYATHWPRLYLDADIVITPEAASAVFATLDEGEVLAARPPFAYDIATCSPLVRAYYRARRRIPAMCSQLWGAGAYALSEDGHARLGRFPALMADDLYVDQLFARTEIAVVPTDEVAVRCPLTLRVLLRTLRRVYSGQAQVTRAQGEVAPVGGVRAVLAGAQDPAALADALVYIGIAVLARVLAHRQPGAWHRDDTNRVAQPLVLETR